MHRKGQPVVFLTVNDKKLRLYGIVSLSKPIKHATPGVNSNVNYGLRVIKMCPCRFMNCSNGLLCFKILIIWEAVHGLGEGGYERSVPSSQLSNALSYNCSIKSFIEKKNEIYGVNLKLSSKQGFKALFHE